MIVYEYPFNERIRTLLRLEDLYERFLFFLQQEHPFQHHVALSLMFEMLEVTSRAELKSELLQELERQKNTLLGFRSNPNVSTDTLNAIVDDINRINASLLVSQGKSGHNVRDNEWLMTIRGRTIIPGGSCKFDLPSYYAWQNNSVEKRRADIAEWFVPLAPLFKAIAMVLRLLRESGDSTKILAVSGSYQQTFQGKLYQMIRLRIDGSLGAIPEISANKYMLRIRFMSQDGTMKPRAFENEVPFELTLCNF